MRLLLVPTLSVPLSVLATVLCLALPIAAVISRPAAAAKPDVKAPPAGGTTTSQAFPFPVKEKTLPNGLHVYVVPYDSPGLVAYYSIVRTGSRNEVEPGKSGFAHFFEHMMFRGTEHYSQDAYNAVIKEMGADSNAFTSDDLTVYHILAGKTALPRIVEIEADRFQHLQYKEPDFQKEARAVLGEYNKNASNPMEKMVETLYDNAFTTHTYKHTTMGFLKDIENMPNQFALFAAVLRSLLPPRHGDAAGASATSTPETVFGLVEKEYGAWARGPARPPVPPEPPQKKGKQAELTWKGATLPMLMVGYHVPGFSTTNVDLPALDVLAELLFAERAPLYKKLVITEQKVEMLAGSADPHVDPEPVHDPGAHQEAGRHRLRARRRSRTRSRASARDGVDDETLAEVLSHVKYAFAGQLSTADRTATTAAPVHRAHRDAVVDQRLLRALRQGHQRRRQAGGQVLFHADQPHRRHPEGGQMSAARSRTMIVSLLLMAGLGARRGRAATDAAKATAASAAASSDDADAKPAGPLKAPPPFRWAGAPPKTVFLPSATNPLVAIRVLFRTGSVDDPKGKEGLAALTAEMVGKGGTRARSYAEVLDALYPLAGNIRVYGDKESVVFEGMVHRDNAEKFARATVRPDPEPALRRGRLHAQPPGRARLHHQDPARQ